jgi:hypothetical protein
MEKTRSHAVSKAHYFSSLFGPAEAVPYKKQQTSPFHPSGVGQRRWPTDKKQSINVRLEAAAD